jgi:hypothetical protein
MVATWPFQELAQAPILSTCLVEAVTLDWLPDETRTKLDYSTGRDEIGGVGNRAAAAMVLRLRMRRGRALPS